MHRRTFISRSGALALTAWLSPSFIHAAPAASANPRVAMGTVLFRYRFKQTKPKELPELKNELTLLDTPAFLRDRFGISNIEFWSNHFESLDPAYLDSLKGKIKATGSTLVNVQIDSSYNLAASDEAERQQSLAEVKRWIDAVSAIGSQAIRINPGHAKGSVDQSIFSMKQVNAWCREKKLVLLTENHFGLEMDPDIHLRIIREAGPDNIHTLPDFGNYPDATRTASLAKILPHAWLISAKVVDFNGNMEHISFDFDACVRQAEGLGFKGLYSVEQWSPKFQDIDYEKVGDWLIEHVTKNV